MENLIKALAFGGILNIEEVEAIAAHFELLELASGEDLLSIGKISRKIGYVDTGILRAFAVDGRQKEVTKYFIGENQWAVEIKSFYDNEPSDTAIAAVTPCRLYTIDRMVWARLNEKFSKLYILTKSLTEATLLNKIRDNEFLHFGSAREKYLFFVKRYPDLARRVPLQYIASYLKITPQSLSRIRKELTQKRGPV